MKTIQVRRTTYAGHCWRSKDELIRDVFWPLHTDEQRLDDHREPIYNSSVPIEDVAWKTSREWWTIETGGKRGSGRSVLAAWHDHDDIYIYIYIYIIRSRCWRGFSRHSSLSSIAPGRSSRLYPVSAHFCCDLFWLVHVEWSIEERHLWERPCVGDHRRNSPKFVLTSPAVSRMFCSSYLDGFSDVRLVAVQLLLRGLLLPEFVQHNPEHSFTI